MMSNRLLRFVFRFLLRYVLIGIAVAASVIYLFPDLRSPQRPVVELQTAASRPHATESGQGNGETGLGAGPVSYAAAVERAAPAVVNIYTSKRVRQRPHPLLEDPLFRHFFGDTPDLHGRERLETSLGSGVILSSRGYILTNNHVIQSADQIEVMLNDGRSVSARLVGADPETDLAVLAVQLPDLPAITIGQSQAVRVGDVVLAIGNPFGVGQTVTKGIVSATGRTELGLSTFENFIQTDAAINPGNSGGALINAYGELVGINTAIFSRSGGSHGIGFAIPADLVESVLTSIIEHGRVVRGWAGIEVQPLTPQLAESFGLRSHRGVIVAGVLRKGPADRAGLRPGDIVLAIGDEPVENASALLRLISSQRPGSRIRIEAWREGRRFSAELRVEERPERPDAGR